MKLFLHLNFRIIKRKLKLEPDQIDGSSCSQIPPLLIVVSKANSVIFFIITSSVVDSNNTLNLDPDPGFWPNLYPDPWLCYQFWYILNPTPFVSILSHFYMCGSGAVFWIWIRIHKAPEYGSGSGSTTLRVTNNYALLSFFHNIKNGRVSFLWYRHVASSFLSEPRRYFSLKIKK